VKGWKSLGEYVEYEARMIESVLKEKDIPVLLQAADYALPVIMGSGGMVNIYVPEELYEKAKKALEGENEEG